MRPPSPNSVLTDWTLAAIRRAVSSSFSRRPARPPACRSAVAIRICDTPLETRPSQGSRPVLEADHRHRVALSRLECPNAADDAGDGDRRNSAVELFDPFHAGRLQLLRMSVDRVPTQIEPHCFLLEGELLCLCPRGRRWEGKRCRRWSRLDRTRRKARADLGLDRAAVGCRARSRGPRPPTAVPVLRRPTSWVWPPAASRMRRP